MQHKILSFVLLLIATAIFHPLTTSCGGDDEPSIESGKPDKEEEGGNQGNTGANTPEVKPLANRLKEVQFIYKGFNNDQKKTILSNFQYDDMGRLIQYEGEYSCLYTFEYGSDKITIYLSDSRQSSSPNKQIDDSYYLENGRVQFKLAPIAYDDENRIKTIITNFTSTTSRMRHDLTWENGNITKIVKTLDTAEPKVLTVYTITYSDEPCETLLPFMGCSRDNKPVSPYSYCPNIDPILVEEGYYGNSMVRNKWTKIECVDMTKENVVTHKLEWRPTKSAVPSEIRYTWTPSGYQQYFYEWED